MHVIRNWLKLNVLLFKSMLAIRLLLILSGIVSLTRNTLWFFLVICLAVKLAGILFLLPECLVILLSLALLISHKLRWNRIILIRCYDYVGVFDYKIVVRAKIELKSLRRLKMLRPISELYLVILTTLSFINPS